MPDVGKLVATLLVAIPRQAESVETVGCSSTTFSRHNSPVFDGSEGPMVVDNYITSFEDLVYELSCTELCVAETERQSPTLVDIQEDTPH
jgi:hypothetical protein